MDIRSQTRAAVAELVTIEKAHFNPVKLLVIGCSSSEIAGGTIGHASTYEYGEAVTKAVCDLAKEQGFAPAFQCCEHLNRALYPSRKLYPFMLDGAIPLNEAAAAAEKPFTLVFGNEASGLPPVFAQLGQSVMIPQSNEIDSLNLAVAVSVGSYVFLHGGDK